jgi:hypothetical protein
VDIYGTETTWANFTAGLEFGVIKISDSVVGNTCNGKERY